MGGEGDQLTLITRKENVYKPAGKSSYHQIVVLCMEGTVFFIEMYFSYSR